MSRFRQWMSEQRQARSAELFHVGPDGRAATHVRGRKRRRVLRRSAAMEALIIATVEDGLRTPTWTGMLYVMGWGRGERFVPLYIGKTGRCGTKNPLSANIANIRANKGKFARWGDGLDYHIGDLSHALFRFQAHRSPYEKYERWAEMLFVSARDLRLRQPVRLVTVPWYEDSLAPSGEQVSLEAAEEELIELGLTEFESLVLNVVGERWWAPAASTAARPPLFVPTRPIRYVDSTLGLSEAVGMLGGAPLLGLDVETELYSQRLCLVQLATEDATVLIDAHAVSELHPLAGLLQSPEALKVIHNAPFERRVLAEHNIQLRKVYDTLVASRRIHGRKAPGGHGLAAVCERELGTALDKTWQKSDWARRPLSDMQIRYAAADAEVLLDLYRTLEPKDPALELAF